MYIFYNYFKKSKIMDLEKNYAVRVFHLNWIIKAIHYKKQNIFKLKRSVTERFNFLVASLSVINNENPSEDQVNNFYKVICAALFLGKLDFLAFY